MKQHYDRTFAKKNMIPPLRISETKKQVYTIAFEPGSRFEFANGLSLYAIRSANIVKMARHNIVKQPENGYGLTGGGTAAV